MIEFGQKLQQARIQKQLTLEEISFQTKINASYLIAIEAGNVSELPEAYTKMFVKTYAAVLEVELPVEYFGVRNKPKRETLSKDSQIDTTDEHEEEAELESENIFTRERVQQIITRYRNLIILLFVAFIILLPIFIYKVFFKNDEIAHVKEPAIKVITVNSDKNHQISVNVRDSIKIGGTKTVSDSLNFNITAVDSSYILFYSDSEKVSELMMIPGRKMTLKANKLLELKIGNVKGLNFKFGGKKVLKDLVHSKRSSAFIKITPANGVERVKESKKINAYLQTVYGSK